MIRRRRSLSGEVIVITGAASGIGRATALEFARRGARLHLTDLRPGLLDEACAAAVAAGAEHATPQIVDSREPEAVAHLADEIFASEGRVDVLHNNAGVCCGGAAEALTLDDWRWQLETNLFGVIHGVHAFLPRMLAQPAGGWIINTASMAGLVGLPLVAPYCTSKFAIVGLSEALDAELACRGLRVIAVCPGAVRSGLMRDAELKLPASLAERVVRGLERFGASPERVARGIVEAVASGDSRSPTLPAALDILPLHLLKRAAPGAFQRVVRLLGRLAS